MAAGSTAVLSGALAGSLEGAETLLDAGGPAAGDTRLDAWLDEHGDGSATGYARFLRE